MLIYVFTPHRSNYRWSRWTVKRDCLTEDADKQGSSEWGYSWNGRLGTHYFQPLLSIFGIVVHQGLSLFCWYIRWLVFSCTHQWGMILMDNYDQRFLRLLWASCRLIISRPHLVNKLFYFEGVIIDFNLKIIMYACTIMWILQSN